MTTSDILAGIDEEISRLQQVRALLAGGVGTRASSKTAKKASKKPMMSAEGRARIAAAQRARWAKQKAVKKSA